MIIGITGSFGAGKTAVANIFKKYGFSVINADEIYRSIYKKDEELKNRIINEFGALDRSKIKKIVFSDANKLKKLNKMAHPVIIREIKKQIISVIKKHNKKIPIIKNPNNEKTAIKQLIINQKFNNLKKNNLAVANGFKNNMNIALDVPLLIEADMQGMVDKIIVVKCDEKIQIKRLLKKGKHTQQEIKSIIKSQMPIEEKLKYADFVVDNSKTIRETERQIESVIGSLQKP